MRMRINTDRKESGEEKGRQLMYGFFMDIGVNEINVGAGFPCARRKKAGQAWAEYFLILAVIAALTVIGTSSLLVKRSDSGDIEPSVVQDAARSFYNRKLEQMGVE